MPPNRFEIRFGPKGAPPGVTLEALAEFAKGLQAAVTAQSGGFSDSPVALVGLDGSGSTVMVLEAPEQLALEAVSELADALDSDEGASRASRQAASRLHDAIGALVSSIPEPDRRFELRVPAFDGRQARAVEVGDASLDRLARRAAELPSVPLMLRVSVVGTIVEIHKLKKELRIRPKHLRDVKITWGSGQWARIDRWRWQKVKVVATQESPDAALRLEKLERASEGDLEQLTIKGAQENAAQIPFERLRADPALRVHGWNSYQAHPLNPGALDRAQAFFNSVRTWLALEGLELPTPIVVPMNDGGIQLEWDHQGAFLEIEFHEKGRLPYLIGDRDGEREGEIEVGLGVMRSWASMLRRV